MAAVVVELTGDEAKLLASMQKIIAQNAKTGESFKKTGEQAKKASDDAVKEQQRVERENKKAADSIYAAHQKMLDDKARESRQAALEEEALARKTAFAEVQAAIKAAEAEAGERCVLICIDTLARAIAGGDENDGRDMGALVAEPGLFTLTGGEMQFVRSTFPVAFYRTIRPAEDRAADRPAPTVSTQRPAEDRAAVHA
jgi:hypothetical protein